ncbi:Molybdopterin-guanine dinucleotide biosynthesis protein [Shewanella piezotolerans WP3]|uniref:Molybdenum cofactor guanylyltransferase n=1 Tax=Shewanella piezotolerans (strain WP3 / JCM 13877) TaxID=225849 RepID=MOBA_SHEPW|nr:molybdenum cofactor guanylyltransferase MobA [Shewanella piezotolerans]B8CVC1.1 RecName: Full=Molybdenum cofactor guanylyltransferase; Short=MoCo guanylyltransferase; AltName: Full=GTP:molybdopterin guanylyltransferase; AltName: Full=Mo-MPT guanylyltransferase; AltName: Full=Molybdopterin guanylyltransferase; AltName: Full=Molybdopterin-guanine dinucleotide synthase; Short=MGD synthase [Shewanella piezotolerans WP3]ACJ31597.1 Molybdopterin-guanine dinucleotide biosynthesis protein [Shewanella 
MTITIDAVILAGGMARRMGGNDKGLVELESQPMIKHAIDRINPQVKEILINANRNQKVYSEFGFEVISDQDSGYLGPLAGMITAMSHTQADYLMVVPCDCPLLPRDLVNRMLAQLTTADAELAVASDGKREQPVVMLLKPSLRASMKAFLDAGERKIDFWYAKHNYIVTDFSDQPNAFINVNTPEQKQQLSEAIANEKNNLRCK